MIRQTILVFVMAIAALPLRGASPDLFPHLIPLIPPAIRQNAIGSIPLDERVYEITDDSYSNLRLFDEHKLEMPYWLRPRTAIHTEVIRFEFGAETLGFKELPGNAAEVIVRRDPSDPTPVGIRIVSPIRNFDRQVTASGSDDQQSWTVLTTTPIFDYTRFIDVRSSTIQFEARAYRFYRLVFSTITARKDAPLVQIVRQRGGAGGETESEAFAFEREPFRIDGVRFMGRRVEKREGAIIQATWNAPSFTVTNDVTRRVSVIIFPTPRLPVTALTLVVRDANFNRQIIIEGARSAAPTNWGELTSGIISALHVGTLMEESLTVTLPQASRHSGYRVTIRNQDNPALEITGVKVRYNEHELLFFPQAGHYSVYCGGPSRTVPQYDVAATLARAPERAGDPWSLAARTVNPSYTDKPVRQPWLNNRAILTGALISMVIVLLTAVARLIRRAEPPAA